MMLNDKETFPFDTSGFCGPRFEREGLDSICILLKLKDAFGKFSQTENFISDALAFTRRFWFSSVTIRFFTIDSK
jgi:hypothetical protein